MKVYLHSFGYLQYLTTFPAWLACLDLGEVVVVGGAVHGGHTHPLVGAVAQHRPRPGVEAAQQRLGLGRSRGQDWGESQHQHQHGERRMLAQMEDAGTDT